MPIEIKTAKSKRAPKATAKKAKVVDTTGMKIFPAPDGKGELHPYFQKGGIYSSSK